MPVPAVETARADRSTDPVLGGHLERQLTLQQLRIFKSVVDHHNFTRAAEALCLTQPAVTHQIQALARAIGQPLFTGRGAVGLTPVGDAVYEKAGRILLELSDLDQTVGDITHLTSGSVRLVADATFGTYVLPRVLGAFRADHPDIEVALSVAHGRSVREQLVRGEADLGIVGRGWDDGPFQWAPLVENVLMCFCAPTYELADRSPLQLEDVAPRKLLLREQGSGVRAVVDRLFREKGLQVRPAIEIGSNEASKRAAMEGFGVAVLSTYAVRTELAVGLLRPVRCEGFPIRQTWHAVWLSERPLPPAAYTFREVMSSGAWRGRPTPKVAQR